MAFDFNWYYILQQVMDHSSIIMWMPSCTASSGQCVVLFVVCASAELSVFNTQKQLFKKQCSIRWPNLKDQGKALKQA
jgi:hypothetical protein